jgi:hypothetical protein
MIGITKTSGHVTYNLKEYVVDTTEEVNLLPLDGVMGSTAFVIETGDVYMLNGKKEWVKI